MQEIYILAASPGSGKSWVAEQLKHKFHYVPHDKHGQGSFPDYVRIIASEAQKSDKPVICDTPFSLSQVMGPLQERGFKVHPVFIIESPELTKERYEKREHIRAKEQNRYWKPIPPGHLTRIRTFLERAKALNAPYGTSEQILKYLQEV